MSNFDDIFEGNASRKGQTNQPFDKEAWAEKKQAKAQAAMKIIQEEYSKVMDAQAIVCASSLPHPAKGINKKETH